MYGDENDNYIVPIGYSPDKWWHMTLENGNFVVDGQIYICPTDESPWYDDLSYAVNINAMPSTPVRRFSYFTSPSQSFMLADMWEGEFGMSVGDLVLNPWLPYDSNVGDNIATRHNGAYNVSYIDGHVESWMELPPMSTNDIFWGWKP
jgi:prepilin-type processing-associated H-X9-DG protein